MFVWVTNAWPLASDYDFIKLYKWVGICIQYGHMERAVKMTWLAPLLTLVTNGFIMFVTSVCPWYL